MSTYQVWNAAGSVHSVSSWIEANQSGGLVFVGPVTEGVSRPYLAFVPSVLEGRQRDWYPVVEIEVVARTATSVDLKMWVVTVNTVGRRHGLSIPTADRQLSIVELSDDGRPRGDRAPIAVTDTREAAAVGTLLNYLPTEDSSTSTVHCPAGDAAGYLLQFARTDVATPDASITVRAGTCPGVEVTLAGHEAIELQSRPELLALLNRLTR